MPFRVGVAGASVVPRDATLIDASFAKRMAKQGIEVIVAHFGAVDPDVAARTRDLLGEHGLGVVQLAGYRPNFVHPDDAVRRDAIEGLAAVLRSARALGAEMFLTGCGSVSSASFYGPHPANHTSSVRQRLVASLSRAARAAEAEGVPIVLECHVLTTLDTPRHIADVLDAVGSPWIRANFDPVNLIGDLTSAYDTRNAMQEMSRVVGTHYVPVAHVKDVAVRVDEFPLHLAEVAPGDGLLDMHAFLDIAAELGEDTALVIEHLHADRIPAALSFLGAVIESWRSARQ